MPSLDISIIFAIQISPAIKNNLQFMGKKIFALEINQAVVIYAATEQCEGNMRADILVQHAFAFTHMQRSPCKKTTWSI